MSLYGFSKSKLALGNIVLSVCWAIVFFINYDYGVMFDDNIWLMFYAFDICCVIVCGLSFNYLGFTGFFVMVSFSSLLFMLSWASNLKRFFINNESLFIEIGPMFKFPGTEQSLSLYVDSISYSFSLLTCIIGFFVFFYAFSYMRHEKNILNFLVYYKLFGWSMILLVLSNTWFTMILGWELIGITSFLLINYWSSKITTLKSAIKAFAFNKISDAALIACACLSISVGFVYINSSSNFVLLLCNSYIHVLNSKISYCSLMLSLLILAAFCKSAQFGFHFWLPDSMEAPVPASALIHSATLVSAGIYIMLRFNSLLHVSSSIALVYGVITSFTAFYGAVIASYQTDVKKILAYSTISHCGMLMYSVTMHSPYITIFYLLAHGFFKSLNFLCVGNFIQHANNYQDISKMGYYFALYKFEFFFFIISLFNLSSSPLFLCFFSKHWLISSSYTNTYVSVLCSVFLFLTAFLGFFYSAKLVYECALSIKRSHSSLYYICNIKSTEIRFFRKSNFLSRFSMFGLFISSIYVLNIAWEPMLSDSTKIFDLYNAGVTISYGNVFYATSLYFSIILIVIASSYILYKKENFFTFKFLFFFCFFCFFGYFI